MAVLEMAFRARKVFRTFEKRAPDPNFRQKEEVFVRDQMNK